MIKIKTKDMEMEIDTAGEAVEILKTIAEIEEGIKSPIQELAEKKTKRDEVIERREKEFQIKKTPEQRREYIKKNYKNMTAEEIAKKLGVKVTSIRKDIEKEGLKKNKPKKTLIENKKQFVKENYGKRPVDEIARITGLKKQTVYNYAKLGEATKKGVGYLSTTKPKSFPIKKVSNKEFVRENYRKMSVDEISKITGLTKQTIYGYAEDLGVARKHELGIRKRNGIMTEERKKVIRKLYRKNVSVNSIADAIGLTPKQIYDWASHHGLKRGR